MEANLKLPQFCLIKKTLTAWLSIADFDGMIRHYRLWRHGSALQTLMAWLGIADFDGMARHCRLWCHDSALLTLMAWLGIADFDAMARHCRLWWHGSALQTLMARFGIADCSLITLVASSQQRCVCVLYHVALTGPPKEAIKIVEAETTGIHPPGRLQRVANDVRMLWVFQVILASVEQTDSPSGEVT